ncbi:MAG: di-heme oxidoredictase family protein [Planctomycetota bacterium]|nr:di-heme oxidoredictase family protein [Planctomycetota bacterium]
MLMRLRLSPLELLAPLLLVGAASSQQFSAPHALTPGDGSDRPRPLRSSATASTAGPAGGASLAVDGKMATRWESAHGIDPSWLTLDLGTSFALHRTTIHWEAANAEIYQVKGSNDNVTWTTLATETGGQFGDRTDVVQLSGVYRYVRMFGIKRSVGNLWGYSIWEMQVLGLPVPDRDGDGVVDPLDRCPDTKSGVAVDAKGCEIIVPVKEVSSAAGILVGGAGSAQPGFSLYVTDADLQAPGTSTCNGGCAATWPPVLVQDGLASGVPDLGTVQRSDGSLQATYQGRPLYFYSGDAAAGDTNGHGLAGTWWTVPYVPILVPLYDGATVLEPELQEDTPTALITRLSDRARDRHAREDQYQSYDHYLAFYWEHRTAAIEIVDTVGKGGSTITFNVATQWKLSPVEAELRFLYRGINTVAEYHNNGIMASVPELDVPGSNVHHYTRSINYNVKTGAPFQVGDRLEFELSHFLFGVPNGQNNYYGTAILYVVGQGVVPWEAHGVFGNPQTELEDSYPIPVAGWLGGGTTLPYQYSDEPDDHFIQMATNLSSINGQPFVEGRRVHHTDFGNGAHDESPQNPNFTELAGLLGTRYINRSCIACHQGNGRALPPAVGQPLRQYVVRVGDASGAPDPQLGSVLQPLSTSGIPEGDAILAGWNESNGLRSPIYSFAGTTPTHFGARIAPQLVGMGLLEAIDESDVMALVDPNDSNADGISGRMRLVTDAESGQARLGRFGWKASQPSVRQQVAAALNTDVGVMSSVLPQPDCGSLQTDCGNTGQEISDEHLEELVAYVALLGVSARRDLNDFDALTGEALFASAGCTACHVDTFQTSPFHPKAELRNQTIHPYTDLLLHDMGPGLASTLQEGDAAGAEWRTPPLWNIGLTDGVSGGEAYLHDGRARSLHEAILWHGGEGDASRLAYELMSPAEQAALLAFLRSL